MSDLPTTSQLVKCLRQDLNSDIPDSTLVASAISNDKNINQVFYDNALYTCITNILKSSLQVSKIYISKEFFPPKKQELDTVSLHPFFQFWPTENNCLF